MSKVGPIKLKVKARQLFNGKILPGWTVHDPEVVAYDLVVRQGCDHLVKYPFTKMTKPFDIALFDPQSAIENKFFKFSNRPNVARFESLTEPIYIFICKIVKDKDTGAIGYRRRIGKKSSPVEEPVFIIHPQYPNQAAAHVAFKVTRVARRGLYKPIEHFDLYKGVSSSPIWYTQVAFYGTCHVSPTNGIQMMDLEAILYEYAEKAKKSPDSLMAMLVDFGIIVSHDLRLSYKSDKNFSSPKQFNDRGDNRLEISHFGDCEDFAHFYMRIFRLMMWCYGLIYNPSDKLFTMWEEFAENYVPLVYICEVLLGAKKEYHSTMLMIPRTGERPVISFEVTNPLKSVTLGTPEGIKKFNEWHLEHYFLIDNYFAYRITGPPHQITVEKMIGKLRNY